MDNVLKVSSMDSIVISDFQGSILLRTQSPFLSQIDNLKKIELSQIDNLKKIEYIYFSHLIMTIILLTS